MNVILPQATRTQIGMAGRTRGGKHPVLWLLHGMSDDHTIWSRRTAIERYAADRGLAVIMPAANLSWYQDMAAGPKYGAFFREELPRLAAEFFPLSTRRSDNFVAGLSMGGYGAFLLGLSQPGRFAAAASLSGALDVARIAGGGDAHLQAVLRGAFGAPERISRGPSDLFALSRRLSRSGERPPKLYACCGTEDFLLPDNRRFAAQARTLGLPLVYEEEEGAGHSWDYWDRQIARVIAWLPIGRPGRG